MNAVFDTPINTSDQSVDRVLNTGLPLIFLFIETPVANSLTESIRSLARKCAGELLFVQLSPSENPQTVKKMGAGRAPALVSWRDGKVFSRAEGLSAPEIERQAEYLLGRGPKPEIPQTHTSAGQASDGSPVSSASAQGLLNATDDNFERLVLRAAQPVLVDFWAPWCGPCRMTNPIVEKLSRELSGKLVVAKVNVDQNPRLSASYGVASIPTMMIVHGGKVVDRWAGAMPEANIRARLQRYV